jgi:Tol biopolymer transport system component
MQGSTPLVGQRLGQYEVVALLGVGGMGEVYRAHDTVLGRDVAIKILPELWLADPDRRARFEREARVLASLNHPNIGAIFGLETSSPVRALVLELVDGATLADRIAAASARSGRGLEAADAIAIARQIADALEAAHEAGIIHRDLKPSNIKITPQGRVKVLDFGLAKPADQESGGSDLSSSPTRTIAATRDGALLGTAPYMSPEQARGKGVDTRTDIWAFGCVLYEMLTGRRAFEGRDATETLASVIRGEPDWRALPPETPPTIQTYLRRCLHKEPRERVQDIGDMRLALEGAFELPAAPSSGGGIRRRSIEAVWLVAAGLAVGAGIAAIVARLMMTTGAPDRPEMRLQVVMRPGADPYSFALAPDGLSIAYVAPGDGSDPRTRQIALWLRTLEKGEERALAGTEGAEFPFWSPNGESLGFFAGGSLKRIDIGSGIVRTLARAPQPRRGAWHPDGTIVFGPASAGPLFRVPADGGTAVEATMLLPGQSNHRWPVFIPGTRDFLFFALGSPEARLHRGSLDNTAVRPVPVDVESEVAFISPRDLLFARQGALWTQRLNADGTGPQGEKAPIASAFLMDGTTTGRAALSASSIGSFAYRSADASRQLIWLDRSGREVGVLGAPDAAQMTFDALSADGATASITRTMNGNADIWLVDRARGDPRRLTTDAAVDGAALFSPDGRRLVYMSTRKADVWDMYETAVDGTTEATVLLESGEQKNSQDWSQDGRYILYLSQSPKSGWDVWALPTFGNRKPMAVATTVFNELSARLSRDGRWVAFSSDETGRSEVYVQPFPGPGPKVPVSSGGGAAPRWRRDGEELFYRSPDNRIMSIAIDIRGPRIVAKTPQSMFEIPGPFARYEVAPDGKQFLFDKTVADPPPVTVVLNWKPPARGAP